MRERAGGGFVLTIFGGVWWLAGSGGVPDPVRGVVLAVGAVAVLALVAAWARVRRSSPESPLHGSASPAIGRQFSLVNVGQLLGIVAAVVAAQAVGHPEAIPALVCLVVGAHFLPLARLFGVPRYTGVGFALIALGVATLLAVPLLDLPAGAWLTAPGFGAALILWTTTASFALPSIQTARGGSGL